MTALDCAHAGSSPFLIDNAKQPSVAVTPRSCYVILFFCLLLFGLPPAIANTHCRSQVTTENLDNQHRLVATNHEVAPVLLRVWLIQAQNLASDRTWPVNAVLLPQQVLQLAILYPANPQLPSSLSYSYQCALGDPSAVHDPTALYRLPFQDGRTFPLTQAYGSPATTHTTPDSLYAVDFTMPVGTPIVAARAGTIVKVDQTHEYGGREPTLLDKANTVTILHDDGTMALYAHLAPGQPLVNIGQQVSEGQQIAVSGSTGYSTGPHLHFAILKNDIDPTGSARPVSLPFRFYVGRPPEAFEPRAGRMATANYSTPANPPHLAEPTMIPVRPSIIPSVPLKDIKGFFEVAPFRIWLAWSGILLLVSALLLVRHRSMLGPSLRQIMQSPMTVNALCTEKRRLLLACHGDRAQMERLIEYEKRRVPLISDTEAARRALERLERERW